MFPKHFITIIATMIGLSWSPAYSQTLGDRAYLAAVVDGLQSMLPRRVDEHTVWTHIAYLPKNQVILYRYSIAASIANMPGFPKRLDAEVSKGICSSSSTRELLDANLTVAVVFTDDLYGAHVSTTIHSAADCYRTHL